MFKMIIKVFLILFVVFGVYFYFNSEDVPFGLFDLTSDIPQVSYQDIVDGGADALDAVKDAKQTAGQALELAKDAVEVAQEARDLIEGDSEEKVYVEQGEKELPEDFQLAVPFTPQAPNADWNLPYQEACEEASVYMVYAYYQGVEPGLIDAQVANAELLDLVDFQNDMYGSYLDTTAEETARLMNDFYGLYASVIDNPTEKQIKEEIAAGRPVIVLAAGQQLENPYFSGDGPLYHALVIKGYTSNKFITNDPGTKQGNGYVYNIKTIMDAMGDWNGGDPANGPKRVIFTSVSGSTIQ
ncbi:C39 family peptidase [Patescibacteria group bacterium]|nr:C39 family peptidase [Patescibacteria group bacterium]